MSQPTPFFGNIDLRNNEIVRAVFENRTTHPTSTKGGKIYFNTTDNCAYCYVGSGTWVDITKIYEHPKYTALSPVLTGAHVLAKLIINDEGHVTEAETRLATLADFGFTGDADANNYGHPTFNVSGTGALNGATIISNIAVNTEGHVTRLDTREMVASDIGAAMINDSLSDLATTWSSTKIRNEFVQIGNTMTNSMRFFGSYNIQTNTPNILTTAPKLGDCYVVTGGGGIFLLNEVSNGSLLIANVDNPQTFLDWSVIGSGGDTRIETATEVIYGIIRLATNQQIIDAEVVDSAVRPHQLNLWFENSELNTYVDPLNAYLLTRGGDLPSFINFTVDDQPTVVEVGTTISGNKTFNWSTVEDDEINTIGIFDMTARSMVLSGATDTNTADCMVATIKLDTEHQTQSWLGRINTFDNYMVNSDPFTVAAFFQRYHGAVESLPISSSDGTENRLYVNDLNKSFHLDNANTFELITGTIFKSFVVFLPPTKTILSVVDDVNGGTDITNDYVLSTITIKDIGGTDRIYNMYTMTVDEAYLTSTDHNFITN